MRFLIDQNVDDRIAHFLRERGHDVHLVREVLTPDSPDQLIAFLAEQEGFIVVTHDKDFRKLRSLLPHGSRKRVSKRAGGIHLNLKESRAFERIVQQIEAIEFHHLQAERQGRRLIVRVTLTSFTFVDQEPD